MPFGCATFSLSFRGFQWSLPGGSSNRNTKPRPIRTIGIIGAGTMGAGIAMNALKSGLVVVLVEQSQEVRHSINQFSLLIY